MSSPAWGKDRANVGTACVSLNEMLAVLTSADLAWPLGTCVLLFLDFLLNCGKESIVRPPPPGPGDCGVTVNVPFSDSCTPGKGFPSGPSRPGCL